MPFDPDLGAIRFGTGLSPAVPPPADAASMLSALAGPDRAAARWPIPVFAQAEPTMPDMAKLAKERRNAEKAGIAEDIAAVQARYVVQRDAARALGLANFGATVARGIGAEDAFRERLTWFWADHFTVRAKQGIIAHLVTPYVEEAIRPHVGGRFADMLKAVVTHPMMLLYLDQSASVGPDSRAARGGRKGLNENLARELLELHTVGVNGPYTQDDVRQMAELLTGLTVDRMDGFAYNPRQAEPGAETVLGVTYSDQSSLETIFAALDDLAVNPATAQFIAGQIAGHFVADEPDPALVAAMAATFSQTGGDLAAVYATMLDHPASWLTEGGKVKQPLRFVVSALRALGVDADEVAGATPQTLRQRLQQPLVLMGQTWEKPVGPDGWAEAAGAWITPQGMAARINWAMSAPGRLVKDLPDPRDLVLTALGPTPPDPVVFAARAAESKVEGVGVILSSAAFQRS